MEVQTTSSSETASPQVLQTPSLTLDDPLAALAIKLDSNPSQAMQPPSLKNDKPRPHVCTECQRPFARLEHLKRHERSHTKEKPFSCDHCQRAFARRDLLLRHQQKLHNTGAPGSRARGQRRGSDNPVPVGVSNRIRKNSTSGVTVAAARARPRANTVSCLDFNGLMLGDNTAIGPHFQTAFPQDSLAQRHDDLAQRHRRSEGAIPAGHSMAHSAFASHLPKLRTQSYDHNVTNNNTLRTAPATFFQPPFHMSMQPPTAPHTAGANTINPAELHFPPLDSPVTPVDEMSLFGAPSALSSEGGPWEELFNNRHGPLQNESAIDESPLPPNFPTDTSAAAFELDATIAPWLMDGPLGAQNNPGLVDFQLDNTASNNLPLLDTGVGLMSCLDTSAFGHLAGLGSPPIVPQQLAHHQQQPHQDMFNTMGSYVSPSSVSNTSSTDTPISSNLSLNGSARHSSVTSASGSTTMDSATRQLMMSGLKGHHFDLEQRVM